MSWTRLEQKFWSHALEQRDELAMLCMREHIDGGRLNRAKGAAAQLVLLRHLPGAAQSAVMRVRRKGDNGERRRV